MAKKEKKQPMPWGLTEWTRAFGSVALEAGDAFMVAGRDMIGQGVRNKHEITQLASLIQANAGKPMRRSK